MAGFCLIEVAFITGLTVDLYLHCHKDKKHYRALSDSLVVSGSNHPDFIWILPILDPLSQWPDIENLVPIWRS